MLHLAPELQSTAAAPTEKQSSEGANVIGCGCKHYPAIAEAVQKLAKKNKTKKSVKSGELFPSQVQYNAVIEKITQGH